MSLSPGRGRLSKPARVRGPIGSKNAPPPAKRDWTMNKLLARGVAFLNGLIALFIEMHDELIKIRRALEQSGSNAG